VSPVISKSLAINTPEFLNPNEPMIISFWDFMFKVLCSKYGILFSATELNDNLINMLEENQYDYEKTAKDIMDKYNVPIDVI
jgi:hypothetical protein